MTSEIRFLLWSIACGVFLGIAYHVILLFRRIVPHHKLVCGLEDLMYWFFSALLMFAVMLVANDGAIRWFSIGAMILGMVIISFLLKYMEKGGKIIYNKVSHKLPEKKGKVRGKKNEAGKKETNRKG